MSIEEFSQIVKAFYNEILVNLFPKTFFVQKLLIFECMKIQIIIYCW